METDPLSTPGALSILETCLYTDDLDAAERFYCDVLGLQLVSRKPGRHRFFRCGATMLLLFQPQASQDPAAGVPPHGAVGPSHVAFQVPLAQLATWQERLIRQGVEIERIVEWPGALYSIYFRDPAGNSLELAPAAIWDENAAS